MEASTAPAPPVVAPLRERLNNVPAFSSETVHVPEWGEDIEVRSMSVARKLRMVENATADGEVQQSKLFPELIIACCFDPETGDPVFTETDAEWIAAQNAAPVELLATAAMRISGVDIESAVDEGKGGS